MENFDIGIEDFLKIGKKPRLYNGIDKVELDKILPTNTPFNYSNDIVFRRSKHNDWVKPSDSFLYIKLRIVKTDGTVYTKTPSGFYPDISLCNNGLMYLFNEVKYTMDNYEIESYNYAGYTTLLNTLLTKPRDYNGEYMCWALDDYDGSTDRATIFYPVSPISAADIAVTDATPKTADYRRIMNLVIKAINTTNNLNIPSLTDAQLPSAGSEPTKAEVITGFKNMILHLDNYLVDVPPLDDVPEDILDIETAKVLAGMNKVIEIFNKFTVVTDADFPKNKGFNTRKNLFFNPLTTVQTPDNAGSHSFIIPLSHIFNFCADFNEIITNRTHELRLKRQSTDNIALFKSISTPDGKVIIDEIYWYIPTIIPSDFSREILNQSILNKTIQRIAYLDKSIQEFYVDPQVIKIDRDITVKSGMKKPKYIIAAFQFFKAGEFEINFNRAIFNNPKYTNELMLDVNNVELNINGEDKRFSYTTNFSSGDAALWYNNYKNLRKSFVGEDDSTSCISYTEFANLYRLYVFDIKGKLDFNSTSTTIRLTFNLNKKVPEKSVGDLRMYIMTYSDNVISFDAAGFTSPQST